MPTPKRCPLFVAAFIGPDATGCTGSSWTVSPSETGCIGSRCAAWAATLTAGEGRCAHLGGDPYPDPAASAATKET